MDNSSLYHAAPLQYVPHILQVGALYAQSILVSHGILPRASAARRDRMLHLADYVHLSLRPKTPLLRDKMQKGYPHVLLQFDRDTVLRLPEIGLVRYNAKAWHSKSAFAPVTDSEEIGHLLGQYAAGHYPSLEVVVKYGLSLIHARQIAFVTDSERAVTETLLQTLGIGCAASRLTLPQLFPHLESYQPTTLEDILAYFAQCSRENALLTPPRIPFD